jgi:hypothetical protein
MAQLGDLVRAFNGCLAAEKLRSAERHARMIHEKLCGGVF